MLVYTYLLVIFLVGLCYAENPKVLKNTPDIPIDVLCQAFAKAFANAASDFTRCFIVNARPLTLCSACVAQYLRVSQTYHDMEQVIDGSITNKWKTKNRCDRWILNADRVMAVQHTKEFFEGLWESSNCQSCFKSMYHNSTYMRAELSQDFLHFQELKNLTDACFSNFTTTNLTATNLGSKACTVCHDSYTQLNDFYCEMQDKSPNLCMDIVDSMNYTRLQWGHQFNCTAATIQDGITITIITLFFILPIVFYVASHIHYERLARKIVKPKRMKGAMSSANEDIKEGSPSPSELAEATDLRHNI